VRYISRKILLVLIIAGLVVFSLSLVIFKKKNSAVLTKPVKSYVKKTNGNAKLFVDNKPVDLLGFYATTEIKEYIDKATEYKVLFCRIKVGWLMLDKVTQKFIEENPKLVERIKQLNSEGRLREAIELLPDFSLPENAADLIDFKRIDDILDYAAKKGVYVVLGFYYLKPPFWWIKNFPDHLQRNDTGGLCYMATFNSPALLKYADQVIEAIVKRYRNHPALLGWDLCFGWTSENNYPGAGYYSSWGIYDYSPIAIKRFREWLKKTYNNDIEALRKAWGNESVTFDNALPPQPLLSPKSYRELVEFINGPGDTRKQWLDWMLFRLEEKITCMLHFAKLYKRLDPNHVLFQTPATPLYSSLKYVAFLSIDYYSYAKSPIDVVHVHPGLSEKSVKKIIEYRCYPPFLKYFEHHGKAALIKWEGRPGVDYDKHSEYIKAVAEMARKTGTGLAIWGGHVPMPGSGLEQPEFTDEQIKLFIETFKSTPEGELKKTKILILDEPRLSFFTYYSKQPYKLSEISALWILLHAAGIDCDVLPVDEVKDNPGLLSEYKLVILDNMFRIDNSTVDILVDYVKGGGWLFIVGRTGAYDWYGGRKFEQLKKLLNISSVVAEVKVTKYSWKFTHEDDPLLEGIKGKRGDVKSPYNILYIPVFDYKAEGYKVLGVLEQNSTVATVGYKGRIVFWFPRLGLQIADRNLDEIQPVIQFIKNLIKLANAET